MLPELKVNRDRMESAAGDAALLATDLAEYLVKKGMPFREAHQVVGALVAAASKTNVPLNEIPLLQMQELSPLFGEDVSIIFNPGRSLEKRTAVGAFSPPNIAARLKHWRKTIVKS
jgi:argininosuccinate lyase